MRQEYLYALIRNKCVVELNTRRNINKMISKMIDIGIFLQMSLTI
jgi:hypothetical protein